MAHSKISFFTFVNFMLMYFIVTETSATATTIPMNNNLWEILPNLRDHRTKGEGSQNCPFIPDTVPIPVKPLPNSLSSAFSNISLLLSSMLNNISLPSVSGVIQYRGVSVLKINSGVIDIKTLQSPTSSTVYGIGSVSKVFPVLQMFMLKKSGIIKSLDDEISDYASGFSMPNPYGSSQPTLRQLASQLGGLPREAPCDKLMFCQNISNAEMLNRLKSTPLISAPNSYPSYSNLAFSLLARVLTEYAQPNTTYEEWVTSNILEPLGMKNTGFNYTKSVQQQMATPYPQPGVAGLKNFSMYLGWDAPCGSMYR